MSTVLNHAKKFRTAHGDPAGWGAVDFEVHQNLVLVDRAARRERLRRPVRRAVMVLLVACALPLNLLAVVIYSARLTGRLPLDRHLDWVDDRLAVVEDAGIRAGDQRFVEGLGAVVERLLDAAGRLGTRLARS